MAELNVEALKETEEAITRSIINEPLEDENNSTEFEIEFLGFFFFSINSCNQRQYNIFSS